MRQLLFAILIFVTGCASKPSANGYVGSQVDPTQSGNKADCCTAEGPNWAIASGGIESSKAGEEILAAGGNLIDAAVAVGFCLAVERPHSDGLSGGGFLTMHLAGDKGGDYFVDFRETAPHRATRDMYLDKKGNVIEGLSHDGALAVAVPGFVAGMSEVHHKWGKLKWQQVLQPAIRLAEKGFPLYPALANQIAKHASAFRKSPEIAKVFLKQGQPLKQGELLVQTDLGKTLRLIAEKGHEAFYQGPLADKIVATIKRGKGIVDKKDLQHYQVKFREPVKFSWKGYELITAPPPSAGGVMLAQMLGVLDGFDLKGAAQDDQTAYAHLLSEVMKRAYADRSRYVGDPEFSKEPWAKMMTKEAIEKHRAAIDLKQSTPSAKVSPSDYAPVDHGTTQMSLIDKEGNAISSTLTINDVFGAGVMVPGTGILLNNEMDDFSAKPGVKNVYGLTGAEANSIAPGKRPVSSMTPTVVTRDGKAVLAVGGAGGSRIISSVFQVMINDIEIKPRDVKNAMFASRMHHQWLPDKLDLEPGFRPETWKALEAKGHKVSPPDWKTQVQAAGFNEKGLLEAVTDPRDQGGVVAK